MDWMNPAERYKGTKFTGCGFQSIPALTHLQRWLEDAMDVA